jgi:RpiB/LacA/LacB family sugar-phosphate isomerase
MIYIGSDHGGFKLKSYIKTLLYKQGLVYVDLGAKVLDPKDDYVDYAKKLARVLVNSKQKIVNSEGADLGILLCRSGQGVCIVANKFKGIRATVAWNIKSAKAARHDDHANVLCLPSDYVSPKEAWAIVEAFLKTPWGSEVRHLRRVKKLRSLEAGYGNAVK